MKLQRHIMWHGEMVDTDNMAGGWVLGDIAEVAIDKLEQENAELRDVVEKVKDWVCRQYDPEFDYSDDHAANGNFDDSFSYGWECGENSSAKQVAAILSISTTKENK